MFAAWFASERTLSIHTIYTTRREAFYWLAVLFTFALGTAAGDLAAERLNLGYALSALIFAALIGAVAIAHFRFRLNAVAAFWIAYILTRPLGASLGDYLSQHRADGGLGLGTTVTSVIFLSAILVVVVYLSVTRVDATEAAVPRAEPEARVLVVAHRTAATPALLEAIGSAPLAGRLRSICSSRTPPSTPRSPSTSAHQKHTEAEHVLALALPLIDQAAGGEANASVSIRHDPMDAIEETLQQGKFDEIILSTLPRSVSRWLHVDLPHRLSHLGLPVTTVIAGERA